ncbi:MAG: 1-aminocyclopropane-1-carboxylate deaminase/D-cysteine desulfhydrase [Thiohalospira sp.]
MIIIEDLDLASIKKSVLIVRDDLFPFPGGGNKARKIIEIAKDVERNKCNAVITTGGIQSNHCRATAIMSRIKGWNCKIIYHGTEERFYSEKGNALLIRQTGVDVEFCSSGEISDRMDNAMHEFEKLGKKPYYIRGGGHNMAGGKAYIDAIDELVKENINPDYIILASGTGSTQAGIMAGLDKSGFDKTKVIGISVARERERGAKVIKEFYDELLINYNIEGLNRDVIFYDDWLYGGYEKKTDELESFINEIGRKYGIFLDTTYTGKAFKALIDLLSNNKISGKILFWHTGGLMNLMA